MAKKAPAKKKHQKLSNVFKVSGDKLERKAKSCPKCGTGTFMGNHKNRSSCGKCGYTEFSKKE